MKSQVVERFKWFPGPPPNLPQHPVTLSAAAPDLAVTFDGKCDDLVRKML